MPRSTKTERRPASSDRSSRRYCLRIVITQSLTCHDVEAPKSKDVSVRSQSNQSLIPMPKPQAGQRSGRVHRFGGGKLRHPDSSSRSTSSDPTTMDDSWPSNPPPNSPLLTSSSKSSFASLSRQNTRRSSKSHATVSSEDRSTDSDAPFVIGSLE